MRHCFCGHRPGGAPWMQSSSCEAPNTPTHHPCPLSRDQVRAHLEYNNPPPHRSPDHPSPITLPPTHKSVGDQFLTPPPRPPSALPPASAAARRSPPCGARAAPRRSRRRPRSAPAARLLLCSITNSTIADGLMSTGALREPWTTLSCAPDTVTSGWSMQRGCRVPCAVDRRRRAGAGPPRASCCP